MISIISENTGMGAIEKIKPAKAREKDLQNCVKYLRYKISTPGNRDAFDLCICYMKNDTL